MGTIDEKNYLKKLGAYFFTSILLENDIDITKRSSVDYLEAISHQITLNNIRDQAGLLLYIEYLMYDNVLTISDLDFSKVIEDVLWGNSIYLADELPFAMNKDPGNLKKIGDARSHEIISAINKMGLTMDSVLSKPHYSKYMEYKGLFDKMSELSELKTSLQSEKDKKERDLSNMLRIGPKDFYDRYRNGSLSNDFLVQLTPYINELIINNGLQVSEGRKHDYLHSMRDKVSDGTIDNIEGAKLYLETLLFSQTPTVSDLGLDARPKNALYGGGYFLLCDLEETTPEILKRQRGMGEQSYEIIVQRLKDLGITINEFGRRVITPISKLTTFVEVDGMQVPKLRVDNYKKIRDNIHTLQERIKLIDLELKETESKIEEFSDEAVGPKEPIK